MIIIDPPLTRLDTARLIVGGAGLGVLGLGAVWALATLAPADWFDVGLWALAAIVVHDGFIAPLVAIVALSSRRTAQRIGATAAAVARAAFAVAACSSLVLIPGIVVRARGPRNDTIHTVDYTLVVVSLWAAAVVIAIGAVIAGARHSRRERARTK